VCASLVNHPTIPVSFIFVHCCAQTFGWTSLLQSGVVEFIDTNEQETTMIAFDPNYLRDSKSYCTS
jgi:hypothetical protein